MTKNSELYPPFPKRWDTISPGPTKTTPTTIEVFEKEYTELAEEFKRIQSEQYALFASKMLDYGINNISLGSTLEDKEDVKLSIMGIWLRCNDKINRLKNLIKRDGHNFVQGESMTDSFIDIANYGIIAMMVLRNKWKK